MSYANLARPAGPNRATFQKMPVSLSAIAPHRGDVTTVRAAAYVSAQETKRIEMLQAHASLRRTAGTAAVPVGIPGIGRA